MHLRVLDVIPANLPGDDWPTDYGQWQSYMQENWPELYAVSKVTVRLGQQQVKIRIKCDDHTAQAWHRVLHCQTRDTAARS